MKEKCLGTLLLLILLVSLLACNPDGNGNEPRSPDDVGFNLLVMAEGDVTLRRQEWGAFHAASFGTLLRRGDQLKPAPDTRIVVLCDNLQTWTVPARIQSGLNNGCPLPPEPFLVHDESFLVPTRGPLEAEALQSIPYIISPRATQLLSPTPTLRWNPVEGATSYTIQVKGGGVDWQQKVEGAEIVYPGNPPLKEGVSYSLIVEADMGQSSRDEELKGGGFSILSAEEAQPVQVAADKVASLWLSAKAEALAHAHLYRTQGIISEAIEILEPLATQEEEEVAIHQTLADLYRQIGLNLLAKPTYHRALELANATGDIEAQAVAQVGLGEVYIALVEEEEGIKWLQKARANYEKLGDSAQVEALSERIDELSV